jgi:formylglycine-generating enzyme required for sulfatase activity
MNYRKFNNRKKGAGLMIFVSVFFLVITPGRIHPEEVNPSIELVKTAGTTEPEKKSADVEMILIDRDGISSYRISKYEVTQDLYQSVMGTNPSYFKGNQLPVEQVSWFNAVEFCNNLSIKEGLAPFYNIDKSIIDSENRNSGIKWSVTINSDANGFRLPTSEEWEYAARSGSKEKYFWGGSMNGDYCWYGANSGESTHPVGTKKPNGYGIYDICGNVREWCFDRYTSFTGFYRVVRDGHYSLDSEEMRIDKTDYRAPHLEFGFTGIRLVRSK